MREHGSCRPWTRGIWHNCSRWCADGCDHGSLLFPKLAAIGQRPGRNCSAGHSVDSTCTTFLHLPIGRQETWQKGKCFWFGKSRGLWGFVQCNVYLRKREDTFFVAKGCGIMLDYSLRVIYKKNKEYLHDGFHNLEWGDFWFLSLCLCLFFLKVSYFTLKKMMIERMAG